MARAFIVTIVGTQLGVHRKMDKIYTISKSGNTVKDKTTGLEWQRNVPREMYLWEAAREYAKKLELDGHTGWRLPTIQELLTIVDYNRISPCINGDVFPTPSVLYWTVSRAAGFDKYVWCVDFNNGFVYFNDVAYENCIRCVC